MPLDDADKKYISDAFKTLLADKATTEILATALKPVLETTVQGITASVDKKLSDAEAKAKAELEKVAKERGNTDGHDKGDKGKGNADGKPDPEVARLKAQQEELARKLEESERARKEEAAKAAKAKRDADVKEALRAAGVAADRIELAMPVLEQKGLLGEDKDGNAGFRFKRSWGEEIVAGKLGAEEWVKTAEGKFYLPPTGNSGTGEGAGGKRPPNGGASGQPIDASTLGRNIWNKALGL
ncbi:MAG TPA: hypothetical protein VEB22_15530 [Phycisphaerales bacterium]|nr:hypothetical protein [Phycisphaerales bacterium]